MSDDRMSEVLDCSVAPVLPKLFEVGARLDRGELRTQGYLAYLVVLHQIIRASVPLMEACREACRRRSTLAHEQFGEYLDHHIPEEQGHDDWLLEDLSRVGVNADMVARCVPTRSIVSLVGGQYYWIHHDDPLALAGYIYVLEGYPPSLDQLRAASEANSVPWSAMSTLRKHANLDQFHRLELRQCIDNLVMSPRQRKLTIQNARDTVLGAADCLDIGISRVLRQLHPTAASSSV